MKACRIAFSENWLLYPPKIKRLLPSKPTINHSSSSTSYAGSK